MDHFVETEFSVKDASKVDFSKLFELGCFVRVVSSDLIIVRSPSQQLDNVYATVTPPTSAETVA